MATLYTNVEQNINKSWILMVVFILLLLVAGQALAWNYDSPFLFYIFGGVGIVSNVVAYYYSDKIALSLAKAQPLGFKDNQDLYRLVDNVCIAAGCKMPKVYIMDEAQPNAFATGRDENNGVIVLTKGIINILNKEELEGVIAHEISHIKNKDTLIQCITVVLVGIFGIISDIVWRMRSRRDSDDRKGNVLALLGLVFLIISPIIAQMLHFAISRKREFLADSTAGLITRNPQALALALEKISQNVTPMKVANNSTAHLFISSPFKGKDTTSFIVKLFSTHPPVEERIKALLNSTN